MKKSIVLILFFIICFMCSCTSENHDNKTYSYDAGDCSYFYDGKYHLATIDMSYFTFEESMDIATNIVLAEYVGKEDKGHYCEFLFNIEKQYKGNLTENYLYVYCRKAEVNVAEKGYSYNSLPNYVEGKSYVLLLERSISVYNEHDHFLPISGTLLPADNLNDLRIHGRQPLLSHSSMTKSDIKTFQRFESYITKRVKASSLPGKEYSGMPYIKSNDIETIVKESDYIVRLKPKTQGDVLADATVICECELIKQYKGKIDKELIEVKFFKNTVDIDSEYIVAMTETVVTDLYVLSSKNSVMGVDKENQILSLLGK